MESCLSLASPEEIDEQTLLLAMSATTASPGRETDGTGETRGLGRDAAGSSNPF